MKILIQPEGEKPRPLEEGYASELELQKFLLEHAELMPLDEIALDTPPLLCIGFEVRTSDGSQDLLYVDKTGMLTIVETKLKRNREVRREVVGQILEYAADTAAWSASDLEDRASRFFGGSNCPEKHRGLTLSQAIEGFLTATNELPADGFDYQSFIDSVLDNIERGHLRLVIAVDEPPPPLLRTVEFVNRFSQRFDMYLFQLARFRDQSSKSNIFVPVIFGSVTRARPARTRKHWKWESYGLELGWSDDYVRRAMELNSRLEEAAAEWNPTYRLKEGWIEFYFGGRESPCGITGRQEEYGIQLWYRLSPAAHIALPKSVRTHRKGHRGLVYLYGDLEDLTTEQIREITRLALMEAGLLANDAE